MIIISLLGMDHYNAIDVTKKLHQGLVEIYGCEDDELLFYAPQSFLIHNGVEQTSFILHIDVDAPETYISKEEEVRDFLSESLTDIAIHFHFNFRYFAPEHEHLVANEDYPLYMTEDNMVKASVQDDDDFDTDDNFDEEYEEPYMDEIMEEFDTYLQAHPDISIDEVYKKISEIRETVIARHHDHEEDCCCCKHD